MNNIETIIKDTTLTTCDNKDCKYMGCLVWCYNGDERSCGIYNGWERKMIRDSINKIDLIEGKR